MQKEMRRSNGREPTSSLSPEWFRRIPAQTLFRVRRHGDDPHLRIRLSAHRKDDDGEQITSFAFSFPAQKNKRGSKRSLRRRLFALRARVSNKEGHSLHLPSRTTIVLVSVDALATRQPDYLLLKCRVAQRARAAGSGFYPPFGFGGRRIQCSDGF